MAVTRARHQCEAGLFLTQQALSNEKILNCLDTYHPCVPARVVLSLPRFLYYNAHIFPLL